jgi:cell division protein DivIC
MLMEKIKPILEILKNKYVAVGLVFIVWMAFFDQRDIGTILERKSKLNKLIKSEKMLNAQIADTKKELTLLKTNAQTIETYARENYMMKKDNEDLFIVEKK